MEISSSVFHSHGVIPAQYTCDGEGLHPSLNISGVPESAKSLALIVHDHDAPGGDFAHWVIWNIDPRIRDIGPGAVPPGAAQGENDAGQIGWTAPCPPSGTHRYEFHLYALDSMLDLIAATHKAGLRNHMNGRIVEEASFTGLYKKLIP